MEATVNTKNVLYVFGEFDRVSIDTKPFHISMETEVGYLLTAADGPELSQQFSHEELAQLGGNGRIRVEKDFFHPHAARKRLLRPQVSVSAMTGRPLRRLTKKDAYCAAALELHTEALMKFTDCSMKANMQLLVGRVMHLAGKHLPDGSMEVKPSENLATPPSPRTLRRWLAERDELGLVGHLDAMSRRGNRGSRHCPEVMAIMMKEVRGYLSPDKPTIKMIYERVYLAVLERNEERTELGLYPLAIPSRETVRRAVRALDPFRVEVARNGLAAARKKFRPVSNGICVTRPLERVEIDEWTVDVQTLMKSSGIYDTMTDEERHSLGLYFEDEVDEKTGRKRKRKAARWVLTAAICCATRCIVGMVISRSANSEAAVQLLQMIVTNKGAWADAVGALTHWDMHGTPELIVFDGGTAFKSLRFRMAAEDLGIMWEMATNGVPESRGTNERVFGTFATDFAPRLSGRTFGSLIEKGDADPESRAALTIDDFVFALIRWVVDIHHNTPHRGLGGETPVQAWRKLTKQFGVDCPPDFEKMRLCFGHQREYRLDKTGIKILGVTYQSSILQNHLRRKAPKKVDVRWHPQDIGTISVNLGNEWVNVPALDPTLKGVAAQSWLTAVRRVKSGTPNTNRLDNVAVREAIKAIDARNKAAMGDAKLNLEDWSDARFDREEKKLLAGIEFYEPAAPTKAKGQLGREIPSVEGVTGQPMDHPDPNGQAPGVSGKTGPAASSISFEED